MCLKPNGSVFNAVAKSVCNPVIQPASMPCTILYLVLYCLFLSTCGLQSVCIHTMDLPCSVLSVFINLRPAERVCSYYGLRVCSQTNK